MIIEVLQKHIKKGEKGRIRSCPIALACKDQLGEDFFDGLGTGVSNSYITTKTGFYELPIEAALFILRFDRGTKDKRYARPKPFSFEIKNL